MVSIDNLIDVHKKAGAALAGAGATIAVTVTNLGTYMHEYGHKLASEALFTGPEGSITINSFLDVTVRRKGNLFGFYQRETTGLTSLGKQLGENLSEAIFSAAGPMVDTTISLGLYAVGNAIEKKHPYVGLGLMSAGALYFVSPLNHAYGACFGSGMNDVSYFADELDIPAIAPAAAIALSLPLLAVALKRAKKINK